MKNRKSKSINIQKLIVIFVISILLLQTTSVFAINKPLHTDVKNLVTGITLESKYDIKDQMKGAEQKNLDICWAFASKGSVESYLKTQKLLDYEFSSRHMDYILSNNYDLGITRDLASYNYMPFALNYFTQNYGPVLESNFPFNTKKDQKTKAELEKNIENIYLDDYTYFPSIIKEKKEDNTIDYTLKLIDVDNEKNNRKINDDEVRQLRNAMKAHIKQYGALMAAIQADPAHSVQDPANQFYYTPLNKAGKINHSVNIVGWDNYFCQNHENGSTSGEKPVSPGAWLVRDSNKPYGNQYYYVSFDDKFIETFVLGSGSMYIGKKYNIYTQDVVGANGIVKMNYTRSKTFKSPYNITTTFDESKNDILGYTIANVFKKDTTKKETIEKISFMAQGPSVALITYLPKLSLETGNYTKGAKNIGKAYLGVEGTQYKTVELETPFELPNEDYAIVVSIAQALPKNRPTNSSNLAKQEIYIPAEIGGEGVDLSENIKMNDKSYILATEQVLSQPIMSPANFIIRAYTTQIGGGTETPTEPEKPPVTPEDPEKPPVKPDDPEKPPVTPEDPEKPPVEPEKPVQPTGEKATFVFGNGEIKTADIGTDGYVMNIPTPPTIEGMIFMGWNPDPRTTKADANTVFTGLWEEKNSQILQYDTKITKAKRSDLTSSPISMPSAGLRNVLIIIAPILISTAIVSYLKYRKVKF